MSLPVAQWSEHSTSVCKVMGSTPVGNSDFFFVPRDKLKYHLSQSIITLTKRFFILTMPLVMTALGADGLLGNSPCGWPEHITNVCSSVISDK